MVLSEVENNKIARIVNFCGGVGLTTKLRQLGIQPGDCVQMLRHAPFDGPYLIAFRGREIALGKGIADKIEVEITSCE